MQTIKEIAKFVKKEYLASISIEGAHNGNTLCFILIELQSSKIITYEELKLFKQLIRKISVARGFSYNSDGFEIKWELGYAWKSCHDSKSRIAWLDTLIMSDKRA